MTRDEFESIVTIGGVDDLLNNERAQKFMESQRKGKGRGGKIKRSGGEMMLLKNSKKKRRR